VSISHLVGMNLGSPAVLAFALGLIAALIRSDLRFPEQVTSLLSTFLLFAIGLKGGLKLRDAVFSDIWRPAVVTLAVGLLVPFVAFFLARRWLKLSVKDAASMAAHYGSVSAVTFTAAETFAKAAGTLSEGYLAALVALLEVPGIIVALVIASRLSVGTSVRKAVHEVLTGKSIVLLLGGLFIGWLGHIDSVTAVEPFFIQMFPGVLCLFLLDLGSLAGKRFGEIKAAGPRLVVFAIGMPLAFGTLGTLAGTVAGLSIGGAAVLGTMAASASYIAAPAAVRVGLPDANVGLSLGAALGVTFPFNLIIGIPLFDQLSRMFH